MKEYILTSEKKEERIAQKHIISDQILKVLWLLPSRYYSSCIFPLQILKYGE